MTPKHHYIHIARFVLEAKTAFALLTGLSDGSFDNTILRDANNLPTIAGTSIAGVLRHRLAIQHGDDASEAIFGFAKGDHQTDKASCLHISWGYIHGSDDKPVEGLLDKNKKGDLLLERLSQDHLIHRERVALNKRGVAKDNMKFDMTLAPAGCRFSFEMRLWSETDNNPHWDSVLEILQSPLHIGHATRSGFGHFRLKRLYTGCFNLRTGMGLKDYGAISGTSMAESIDANGKLSKQSTSDQHESDIYLELDAEDFWRFGQTGTPLKKSDKAPDAVPLSEPVIRWQQQNENTERASFKLGIRKLVIPGSGIKGAIAHRLTFHYRRLTGRFSSADNTDYSETGTRKKNDLIADLFGYEADTNSNQSEGQAGLILFRDSYMDYDRQKEEDLSHIMHTSIDRFTGGVRDKALFSEEMVWKKTIKIHLDIDWYRLEALQKKQQEHNQENTYANLFKALKWTLDDLQQGRLALGAGASKGHGYFTQKVEEYSDKAKAIMEDA